MEAKLSHHLILLADTYRAATGASSSTIGEKAGGDWRFFDRLRLGQVNFRVRTYDRAVCWFADNWPEAVAWPSDIPRPPPPGAAAAGSSPSSAPNEEPADIFGGVP